MLHSVAAAGLRPARHDDMVYVHYGPAQGLHETRVGAFTQTLYDAAKNMGWTVISMKRDWRDVFPASIGRAIK